MFRSTPVELSFDSVECKVIKYMTQAWLECTLELSAKFNSNKSHSVLLIWTFTSNSSSRCWKAPKLLTVMSAGFLRAPSPRRRPPEPRDDMELEELGSRGLLTVGNCGRLYGRMSSEPVVRAHLQNLRYNTKQRDILLHCASHTCVLSRLAGSAALRFIPFASMSSFLSVLSVFAFRGAGSGFWAVLRPIATPSLISPLSCFGGNYSPTLQSCLGGMCGRLEHRWRRNGRRREI